MESCATCSPPATVCPAAPAWACWVPAGAAPACVPGAADLQPGAPPLTRPSSPTSRHAGSVCPEVLRLRVLGKARALLAVAKSESAGLCQHAQEVVEKAAAKAFTAGQAAKATTVG